MLLVFLKNQLMNLQLSFHCFVYFFLFDIARQTVYLKYNNNKNSLNMSTFVATLEEYGWVDKTNIVENIQEEDEVFPRLPDKWPVDTFVKVDSVDDDKKIGR